MEDVNIEDAPGREWLEAEWEDLDITDGISERSDREDNPSNNIRDDNNWLELC